MVFSLKLFKFIWLDELKFLAKHVIQIAFLLLFCDFLDLIQSLFSLLKLLWFLQQIVKGSKTKQCNSNSYPQLDLFYSDLVDHIIKAIQIYVVLREVGSPVFEFAELKILSIEFHSFEIPLFLPIKKQQLLFFLINFTNTISKPLKFDDS